ncbi:cytochrome P450 [Streptomyces sp. NPDC003077]|uniref:cytochrome P450 family protein n=1 Tax=Streptomyces sp. NPDC003077 TaxID=3154443 RepID=UPI0033AA93ED
MQTPSTARKERPDIVDLRELGPDFHGNPHPVYARMRAEGPVHRVRTTDGEDVWLVVGYDQARAVLNDPRFSKDWSRSASPDLRPSGKAALVSANMLESDPPRHTRLRKLVAREFTTRRVEALRPRVREITEDLLDAMLAAPDGRADLVADLAFPLPITVICELLGVPVEDRATFRAWTDKFVMPDSPQEAQQAVEDMAGYIEKLVADKRARPGDDLLSALTRTAADDGERLAEDELIAMAYVLLIAGHETTVNLITNGMYALLTHPDQLALLRADMSLLDNAVEEMLRYEGPVEAATYRFPLEPVTLGDTVLPAGASVLVVLADAHRDPSRFPDPDRFDIRRPTGGHLAFGHGIHFCIGAPLARMEARIAIRRLLERCPRLGLVDDPGTLRWFPNMMIRGVRELWVGWG